MNCNIINAHVHLKDIPEKDIKLMEKFLNEVEDHFDSHIVKFEELKNSLIPHAEHILKHREEWMFNIKQDHLYYLKAQDSKSLIKRFTTFLNPNKIKQKYEEQFTKWVAQRWEDGSELYYRLERFGENGDYKLTLHNNETINVGQVFIPKTQDIERTGNVMKSILTQMDEAMRAVDAIRCLEKTISQIHEIATNDHIVGAEMEFKQYKNLLTVLMTFIKEVNDEETN